MAEEKVDAEETPASAPAPAKRERGGRLGTILPIVNTVVLVAVLVLQVVRPGGLRPGAHAGAGHAAPEAPERREPAKAAEALPNGLLGPTLRLPDFVVHLRDPDTDRYARVSFEIEVRDEKAKEGLTARLPLVRDAFLLYLSDRSSTDFRGGEAIAQIKAALAQKLGEVAREVGVRGLYITELVVQ